MYDAHVRMCIQTHMYTYIHVSIHMHEIDKMWTHEEVSCQTHTMLSCAIAELQVTDLLGILTTNEVTQTYMV